jgi:transposase
MAARKGRKFWMTHVRTWERSELSQAAYCRQHGVKLKAFGYWKRKLTNKPDAVSFVQLPSIEPHRPNGKPCSDDRPPFILHVGHAYHIELRDHFDSSGLKKLLRVLERR